MHSWRVLILPFLEEQELFAEYDFTQPWNSESNSKLADRMPKVYASHGEYRSGVTTTNFLAVVGANTLWPGASSRTSDEIIDDPFSTIMLVENHGQNVHWMEPRDLQFETMSFRVDSPAGLSGHHYHRGIFAFGDTAYFSKEGLPEAAFRAMLTINGGEEVLREGRNWRVAPDDRLGQSGEATESAPR